MLLESRKHLIQGTFNRQLPLIRENYSQTKLFINKTINIHKITTLKHKNSKAELFIDNNIS